MIGAIKKIFLVALLLIVAALYYRGSKNPLQLIPYPYLLPSSQVRLTPQQVQEINHSQVLIIGDQMGVSLNRYLPRIIKESSSVLSSKLKAFSLARSGDGIHRTIAKIRQLKKVPPVVIFMGGSQEQQEKKFHLADKKTIMTNLRWEKNDIIGSLIMTFPWLSRLIYTPINYIKLKTKPQIDKKYYDARETQHMRVLSYRLYQRELRQLHQEISARGGILVTITAPANLELTPKRICLDFPTPLQEQQLSQVERLLEQKDSKSAFRSLQQIENPTHINTQFNYLAGKIAINLGQMAQAQEYLKLAAIYDCTNLRVNPIYNIILKKFANNNGLLLLDFDRLVNNHSRDNILFFDQLLPQPIFYYLLVDQLTNSITQLLQL